MVAHGRVNGVGRQIARVRREADDAVQLEVAVPGGDEGGAGVASARQPFDIDGGLVGLLGAEDGGGINGGGDVWLECSDALGRVLDLLIGLEL